MYALQEYHCLRHWHIAHLPPSTHTTLPDGWGKGCGVGLEGFEAAKLLAHITSSSVLQASPISAAAAMLP